MKVTSLAFWEKKSIILIIRQILQINKLILYCRSKTFFLFNPTEENLVLNKNVSGATDGFLKKAGNNKNRKKTP